MKHARFNKIIAVFIALAFALQVTLPPVAFADQRTVDLDNHTVQTDQTTLVADITIDNIDKPVAGVAFDNKATVTASDATAVAKAEAAVDEHAGQPATAQPAVAEADGANEAAPAEIGEPDETAPATDAPTPVVVEAEAEADEAAAVAREDV